MFVSFGCICFLFLTIAQNFSLVLLNPATSLVQLNPSVYTVNEHETDSSVVNSIDSRHSVSY